MTQLKYHDGDRFRDAPKFRELPEPVGDPLFWWPLHAGYQSETTGFGQGTVKGAQWRRGNYAGGWALEGDGVDDYVLTSDWGDFGSNLTSDLTICLTFQSETDSSGDFIGISHENDDQFFSVNISGGDNPFRFILTDSDDDTIRIDQDGSANDGVLRRAVCRKSGNTANDLSIWFDGSEIDTTIDSDENFSNPTDFEGSIPLLGRNSGSEVETHLESFLDNVVVYDYALTEEEIEEDYRRQPWSEVN